MGEAPWPAAHPPHRAGLSLPSHGRLPRQRQFQPAGLSDSLVDLRVDEHERPLEELRRIYALHQAIFGKTPPEDWLEVDAALAEELRERLARLGFDGELDETLIEWAGKENLEERVDGVERVDPVVLEELRRQT
jgi:uncharacterized Ntn-hydrolase superfamily protein